MLAPGDDRGRWSEGRAATVVGYVRDVKVGGVETVIELPYDLDWFGKDDLAVGAVDPGLIRLSVGLEDIDELTNRLRQRARKIERD